MTQPRSTQTQVSFRKNNSTTFVHNEQELTSRWQNGDTSAGDTLVKMCLPLITNIALEYRRWGEPLEDLVQQGCIGFLKAAKKFNSNKNCKLMTYASYWVRAEIREYVMRCYRLVRIGTTKGERRLIRDFRRTQEEDPNVLAQKSGLSKLQVEQILPMIQRHERSLNTSMYEYENNPMDLLEDSMPTPHERVEDVELKSMLTDEVSKALERLPQREAYIVQKRWLLDEAETLETIGIQLGVSKERVRQLQTRAQEKLYRDLGKIQAMYDA